MIRKCLMFREEIEWPVAFVELKPKASRQSVEYKIFCCFHSLFRKMSKRESAGKCGREGASRAVSVNSGYPFR